MAPPSLSSSAALHALTERLASHPSSRHASSLSSLSSSLLPPNLSALAGSFPLSPAALERAASAYRQPAPPPQLPVLQLVGRHEEGPSRPASRANGEEDGVIGGCPVGALWPPEGEHDERRCASCDEEQLDGFVNDMGLVLRREFDCWVEQCWTEAFHHLFTMTLPTLFIHLILTGSSPTFLRQQVVHGGPALDQLFQSQMLDLLYQELELRLSGSSRPPPSSSAPANNANPLKPAVAVPSVPRDGVCFHGLSIEHGTVPEDDDHGLCLCELTSCLGCFHRSAVERKGPASLLPYELVGTSVSAGWTGAVESDAQARARRNPAKRHAPERAALSQGQGFVRNPKPATVANGTGPIPPRPPVLFPHPQMTDMLAVEEHLRWRLKEMGASDPAVESRYGPGTGDAKALEGIDMSMLSLNGREEDTSEDGSVKGQPNPAAPKAAGGGKMAKLQGRKGKVKRVNGQVVSVKNGGKEVAKKDNKEKVSYLPKEWAEAEPSVRNMAITLTFRHFVKLLYDVATSNSPFSYPLYPRDIDELDRVHPVALYRRLAEPSVIRQHGRGSRHTRAWIDCMDRWAEELGAREKTQGNKHVSESHHSLAIESYTRAISLDAKKTVYFSNRAVALNALGEHERAELDCRHILSRDAKNGKAFFQRALARRGLGRWKEAEGDLKEVLRFQPGNESAKKLMTLVKDEVARYGAGGQQQVKVNGGGGGGAKRDVLDF